MKIYRSALLHRAAINKQTPLKTSSSLRYTLRRWVTNMAAITKFGVKKFTRSIESGPMRNVMVALPNIGGALCSTPQSLADAHYYSAVQ